MMRPGLISLSMRAWAKVGESSTSSNKTGTGSTKFIVQRPSESPYFDLPGEASGMGWPCPGLLDVQRESQDSRWQFIPSRPAGNRGGHHLILFRPQTRMEPHASFFKTWLIYHWNGLPAEIVSSPSLTIFESNSDGAGASLGSRWFPN